jgi:hypothetical protein
LDCSSSLPNYIPLHLHHLHLDLHLGLCLLNLHLCLLDLHLLLSLDLNKCHLLLLRLAGSEICYLVLVRHVVVVVELPLAVIVKEVGSGRRRNRESPPRNVRPDKEICFSQSYIINIVS